jgi:hypothetical protein
LWCGTAAVVMMAVGRMWMMAVGRMWMMSVGRMWMIAVGRMWMDAKSYLQCTQLKVKMCGCNCTHLVTE